MVTCDSWRRVFLAQGLEPEDCKFYCATDKVITLGSVLMLVWTLLQICEYVHYDFACMHFRLRIIYLTGITCIMQFLFYGMLEVDTHQQMFLVSEAFSLSLYSMVFYFFLYKAATDITNPESVLQAYRWTSYVLVIFLFAMTPYAYIVFEQIYNGPLDKDVDTVQLVLWNVVYKLP